MRFKTLIENIWFNIATIIFLPLILSLFLYMLPKSSFTKTLSILLIWIVIFIVGRAMWFLLKKINNINLMSDLALWLLWIGSGIMIVLSALFFFSALAAAAVRNDGNVYPTYAVLILVVAVFILGIFGIFRFRRRHRILGIWH